MASAEKVFTLLDADGDGKMTPEELGRAMRCMGNVPTEKEIKSICEQAPDGVDIEDFRSLLESHSSASDSKLVSELRDSFRVFDRDNSGCIPELDLRFCLMNMGEVMTSTEVDRVLKDAPKNKDGEIKFEDMIKMLLAM